MGDRYPTIKIGAFWLTSDGSEEGAPCKCRVEGEPGFASPYAVDHRQALDFTVHTQIVARGVSGVEFTVVVEYCPEGLLGSIRGFINEALADGGTVRIVVESLTDFDVQALPVMQDGQLFTYESRSGGIARNVRLRFISTAPGA